MGIIVHDRSFHERMTAIARAVEAELDRLLAPEPLPGETIRPPRLLAAMRYAALGGGKRLRPFILMESARLFGADGPGALRAACALEMVHCYSLVHDDLPAMDDDDLRRGRPTVHKAFDEATAILAGDALLTYAFDVMADTATHADAEVRAEMIMVLARAAGAGGMAGGQTLDLEAEKSTAPLPRAAIETLQAMKTGALLRFAAEAGAILGRAGETERQSLREFGRALGAAFQIADDILDAKGDAGKLGKAAAKDAARNKATLVATLGLAGAERQCEEYLAHACNALAGFGAQADILRASAHFVVTRDH